MPFPVPFRRLKAMDGEESVNSQEVVSEARGNGAVGATVSADSAPTQPSRRGRPKGSVNKVNRIAKEAILAAAPHHFLIRIMEGRKFKRAGEEAGRRTVDCYPTLLQSITAAEVLLRKVAPDIKAVEVSGPEDSPIEQRTEIVAAAQRVSDVTEIDPPAPGNARTATTRPSGSPGCPQKVEGVSTRVSAAQRPKAA